MNWEVIVFISLLFIEPEISSSIQYQSYLFFARVINLVKKYISSSGSR